MSSEVGAWVGGALHNWQEIDRGLRVIAKKRGALDVEEAALLCLANRREIWRALGKPSLLAYMEDVLGYAPKTARDRIRVAIALDEMPVLAEALESGEQSYSALRELTRVVTPNTQREWCHAVRGKNLRQIEELVGGHQRGDLPTDPPNPDLAPKIIRFEISTATYALLRQAQQILADEAGRHLEDDELVATLCSAVIDGVATGGDAGRARHQILTTVCSSCSQGWQQGGGVNIPVSATDVAIAECDAQRIGSDREPSRATQDIAPKVRRHVERRDHGACTVPGCRSSRHLDVHHVVHRVDGGGHDAKNLTMLCGAHHRALHEGTLVITGSAPNLKFDHPLTRPMPALSPTPASHVGRANASAAKSENTSLPMTVPVERANDDRVRAAASRVAFAAPTPSPREGRPSYAMAVAKTEAVQALVQLGYSKPEARKWVEQVAGSATDMTLEQLVRGALAGARAKYQLSRVLT